MSDQDSTSSRAKIPNPPDPQEVTTHPRHVSSRRDKEKKGEGERERAYTCARNGSCRPSGIPSIQLQCCDSLCVRSHASSEQEQEGWKRSWKKRGESGRGGEGRGSGEKRRDREMKGNRGRREGGSEGEERGEKGWWSKSAWHRQMRGTF